MTDQELIARLREGATWDDDVFAANRIEELVKERDALFHRTTLAEEWRDHDKSRAEAAKAKLAKAVEIGNAMAKSIAGNYYLPGIATKWFTVLAELEGKG